MAIENPMKTLFFVYSRRKFIIQDTDQRPGWLSATAVQPIRHSFQVAILVGLVFSSFVSAHVQNTFLSILCILSMGKLIYDGVTRDGERASWEIIHNNVPISKSHDVNTSDHWQHHDFTT